MSEHSSNTMQLIAILGEARPVAGAYGRGVAIGPDSCTWVAASGPSIVRGRDEHVVGEHVWPGHAFEPAAFAADGASWLLGAHRLDAATGRVLASPLSDERLRLGLEGDARYDPGQPVADRCCWTPEGGRLLVAARLGPPSSGPAAPPLNRLLLLDVADPTADRCLAQMPFGYGSLAAGRRWLAAARGGGIDLYDADGAAAGHRDAHAYGATALAFGPEERWLASGGGDGGLALWDLSDPDRSERFEAHGAAVKGLVWHPNGRMLVSGGHDGRLAVWSVGDPPRPLAERSLGPIESLALAPDGSWLLVALGPRGALIRMTLEVA